VSEEAYLDTGALAEVFDELAVSRLKGIHGDDVRLVRHHLRGKEGGREGGEGGE